MEEIKWVVAKGNDEKFYARRVRANQKYLVGARLKRRQLHPKQASNPEADDCNLSLTIVKVLGKETSYFMQFIDDFWRSGYFKTDGDNYHPALHLHQLVEELMAD